MQINKYLQRIGLDGKMEVNLETLQQLQSQHLLHVPFENLDVIHHNPILLDLERFYKKVVLDHRGGFCYELNGLFNWLLQSVGFNCHLISGTVLRPDGSSAKKGTHAAQIVELDQPYLVDVGFGDSNRMPIPLTNEIQEDVSGVYRTVKINENIVDLQKQDDEHQWKTIIQFDTTAKKLTDFKEACHFNQTSPKSSFTQKEIVSLATLEGRVTLSGESLTVTKFGEKQEAHISAAEKPLILEKYFHIQL